MFECSDVFACRANVSVYECFKPSAETVFAVSLKKYVDFNVRMLSRSNDRIRATKSKNNSAYSEVIEE